MREHEVPTHLQAEDRVLLWFTFPQIVAVIAVCALAYGAYRYAPGPSELRLVLAVTVGVLGVASTVGRVGGRGLPAVLSDLLRFRLVPRRYVGTVADLVRTEAPVLPRGESRHLKLAAMLGKRAMRRLRRRKGREERRRGRMPFRPHRWFGERRKANERNKGEQNRRSHRRPWRMALALPAMAAILLMPGPVMADGHWLDEIDYVPPEPVPGRRLFVEELHVSGDTARVVLKGATDLDVQARAFGGDDGRRRLFTGTARLAQGERIEYSLPLSGGAPSLTFSWQDRLGQAGALSLKDHRLPHPLPSFDGEVCDVSVTSLSWKPGTIEGVLESECVTTLEERMDLATVAGHESVSETAVMDARVASVSGSLTVTTGDSRATFSLVTDGETAFSAPLSGAGTAHYIGLETIVQAALEVDVPPLVRLTHHPETTREVTRTVSLVRPGTGRQVSKRVRITHDDGTITTHTISAYLSIPAETVEQDVVLNVVRPEHVSAEVEDRGPQARSRSENSQMALGIGADEPYRSLNIPDPEDQPEPSEQTPLTDDETSELLGAIMWRPW